MSAKLEKLLQDNPTLWRGRDTAHISVTRLKTGFAELDAVLPGSGWPTNALVEIVAAQWGIGELQLLLPVIAQLSRQHYWIVWIAPPYLPYAPALDQSDVHLSRILVLSPKDANHDTLWSMEKILRAEACGMALAWPEKLTSRSMRRLQLAAEAGNSLGVVFRTTDPGVSPAALRLHLSTQDNLLQVRILKARGRCRLDTVHLTV